jgi:hypothetical protein
VIRYGLLTKSESYHSQRSNIYIIAFERGARNGHESVDGERFRMFGHTGDGSKN